MSIFRELSDRVRHFGDITCRHAVELVTDYLEGAMTSDVRRQFERHLRGCAECVTYVEQVRGTIDSLGRVHPEPPTGETLEALVQAFRDFHREAGDEPRP